jgi:hypothetical protein
MENWNNYLNEDEEEMRIQILKYLDENNIVLTEAELKEAMPRWLRKIGAGAALAGTLAATAPSAEAADWQWGGGGADADAPAQQAEVEPDFSKDYGNNATGEIFDNGDGTYNVEINTGDINAGNKTTAAEFVKSTVDALRVQFMKDVIDAGTFPSDTKDIDYTNSELIDDPNPNARPYNKIYKFQVTISK